MTNGEDWAGYHADYAELHSEPLGRPFPAVSGQVMVSHRAIFFTAGEAAAHRAAVMALAATPGAVTTPEEQGIQLLRFDAVELRIERHTEFTTFTVFAPQTGLPFAESAIDLLPEGLLDAVPGKILAAVEIAGELVAAIDAGTVKTMERVHEYFDHERLVGGWVVERVALVWSHFRPDDRGATRFLVQIHRLTSGRYGRLLQRLVEIETYRLAATLGLPLAREVFPEIEKLEARYFEGLQQESDERGEDFAHLAAEVARLEGRCLHRLRRTAAYAPLLAVRVAELREEAVPGYQTLGEFFDRRLTPAWRLCNLTARSLADLSTNLRDSTGQSRSGPVAVPRVPVAPEVPEEIRRGKSRAKHFLEAAAVLVVTVILATLLQLVWHSPSPAPWVVALVLVLTAAASWRWWSAARSRQT